MAELAQIKSFANPKGSTSGTAKPGIDSQPTTVARYAAVDYERTLTEGPDGSRITSTEKNVLLNLALFFNAEAGAAWPRIETLGKYACVSDRHCRRSLESLERKKVIQRVYMRREGKGSQTSNEYFFPALGSAPQTPEARARRLAIQKVPRTPMTPKAGMSGRTRPAAADTSVRPSRTNTTGGPGHGRPPIESLGDSSIDLQSDAPRDALPARKRAASVPVAEPRKTPPAMAKAPFADLGLARGAWDSAMGKLRAAHGANEIKKYRFRDVTVVSSSEDGAGTVHLTLRSPAPDKARAGLAKHEAAISLALCAFYGRTVKLRVIDHEQASDSRDEPPKRDESGESAQRGGRGV